MVGDRLHVPVRYSTKKCQCVMQDLRVLSHAVGHHYVQPHIPCCRPRPSSMPIFVGVLMARGERLRAPPGRLGFGHLPDKMHRSWFRHCTHCTQRRNTDRFHWILPQLAHPAPHAAATHSYRALFLSAGWRRAQALAGLLLEPRRRIWLPSGRPALGGSELEGCKC